MSKTKYANIEDVFTESLENDKYQHLLEHDFSFIDSLIQENNNMEERKE